MDDASRNALQAGIDRIVSDLVDKGVYLNRCGNAQRERSIYKRDHNPIDVDAVHEAMIDIPKLFVPAKRLWSTQSYGGKHDVEYWRRLSNPMANYYVSTGDFIAAMLLLGYEAKWRETPDAPAQVHCLFRARLKKPREQFHTLPDYEPTV